MNAPVPFFDLKAQYQSIRSQVEEALGRVLESQQFILGPDIAALETEIAAYCGTRFAVACASGSDALLLALLALGIQPGDEVLTTPYSFFATAGYIVRAGARPVFADIDLATYNLDPTQAARVLDQHPNVRAILPVHLYGACADMTALIQLARQRGIPVIEDAAQAIGAEWTGRRAGSLGDIGCFSFFPTKNLGAGGDGGILTTNNSEFADRLRSLRMHGSRVKYHHEYVGLNSRLDSLQAAILRVKLKHLDGWTAARQNHAAYYKQRFCELKVPVQTQQHTSAVTRHVYNQFVIRTPDRDGLRAHLQNCGIGTEIYYPVPLPLQECFRYLGYTRGDFPASEEAALTSLALPVYPELAVEQLETVCEAIGRFFTAGQSLAN